MKRCLMIVVLSALLLSCSNRHFAWQSCTESPSFTECSDGSIYMGISRESNSNLFMMPCDLGQHLQNDRCIGDTKTYAWSNSGAAAGFNGAPAGQENAKELVQHLNGKTDTHETGEPFAAQACAQQTFGGHNDWHLPSLAEFGGLSHFYETCSNNGCWGHGEIYWTSLEIDQSSAWIDGDILHTHGLAHDEPKSAKHMVRCVRKVHRAPTVDVGPIITPNRLIRSDVNSCHATRVGEVCPDGTIYAGISPDGNIPMYTTPCDQGMHGTQSHCEGQRTHLQWGTSGTWTEFSSKTTGELNTINLVEKYGKGKDNGGVVGAPAAQACADLKVGGLKWYLPSVAEFALLRTNFKVIGGFENSATGEIAVANPYWSSTEDSDFGAYVVYVASEQPALASASKNDSYMSVRCVAR